MKAFILLVSFLAMTSIYAAVGVNTPAPAGTTTPQGVAPGTMTPGTEDTTTTNGTVNGTDYNNNTNGTIGTDSGTVGTGTMDNPNATTKETPNLR